MFSASQVHPFRTSKAQAVYYNKSFKTMVFRRLRNLVSRQVETVALKVTAKHLVGTLLPSTRLIQSLAIQMMEKRLDKPRTGHLPNRKVRSLTNLPFAFPARDQQASSFGLTVNITASHS